MRAIHDCGRRAFFSLVKRPWRGARVLYGLAAFAEWRRVHGFDDVPKAVSRERMYELLQMSEIGDDPIDYLEFGVAGGDSLKLWARLNRHRESRFIGFDSFRGLPEAWTQLGVTFPQGAFSTGGAAPCIPDPRVTCVVGPFQETLDDFLAEWTPGHRLVVHLDADLYSSTLYVLCALNRLLVPGTLVLFDEFGAVDDEFRAFVDFCGAFDRQMRPIGRAGRYDMQACLKVVR